jgi:hypothetical protein
MITLSPKSMTIASLFALAGCASTPGAQPQDMSKAQHEQAAAAHDQAADPHAAQYSPAASVATEKCGDPRRPCWTSISNPTEQHKTEAEKHRKMAADHRAAAQALRDAEGRSCAGIADSDRDMSPFDRREDVTNVAPYKAATSGGKQQTDKLRGAVVTFRAVQGMTGEWLQRIVDCHVARNAALGNEMPEMASCPLNVKGAKAKVSSTGNGFAVTVESDDPASAQEILKRSQTLAGK